MGVSQKHGMIPSFNRNMCFGNLVKFLIIWDDVLKKLIDSPYRDQDICIITS